MTNIAGSGSISQRHGSADPDPSHHQNVMDPQHWFLMPLLCNSTSETNTRVKEEEEWDVVKTARTIQR
jgi:hypothetical protein